MTTGRINQIATFPRRVVVVAIRHQNFGVWTGTIRRALVMHKIVDGRNELTTVVATSLSSAAKASLGKLGRGRINGATCRSLRLVTAFALAHDQFARRSTVHATLHN